ncbi:TatD family hydrolase [Candidatus Woesearchaeota archaeon]|nr:TatD family hydrolase [Candidatus Woesearchaeota archaeon]
MMLVDCHAHLDFEEFEKDFPGFIRRQEESGVKAIIANGVNPESNKKVLVLAEQYKIIKPALGAYPTDMLKLNSQEYPGALKFIEKNKDKIVAIGEVGLDFSEQTSDNDINKSIQIFRDILRLVKKIGKPVIIHSRKAEEKVFEILEHERMDETKKVVLHCFCGKKKLVRLGKERGYYFTVPTNIGRNQQTRMIAEIIPLSHVLTETDSPYLHPDKTKFPNEPRNVAVTIKELAIIKKMDAEEVSQNVFMNYQRLFL